MNSELFLPVSGYEGLYEISNKGRLKSLEKTWSCGRGNTKLKHSPETILSARPKKNGYVYYQLFKDGKGKIVRAHRLVAETFIPNPENKPQVNHKNGCKSDNTVENLEWATSSENVRHAIKTGLSKANAPKGVNHSRCKTDIETIISIKKMLKQGERPYLIAQKFNLKLGRIIDIKHGRNWKSVEI